MARVYTITHKHSYVLLRDMDLTMLQPFNVLMLGAGFWRKSGTVCLTILWLRTGKNKQKCGQKINVCSRGLSFQIRYSIRQDMHSQKIITF
jgi:hypothetical protein